MVSVQQELIDMGRGVSKAFGAVKEELDEHLDAINQNTNELQAAYQYIAALEAKIEKLSERVDELSQVSRTQYSAQRIELSLREQEVFLLLYTAQETLHPLDMAKVLGLNEELVHAHVARLVSKGIPVLKDHTEFGIEYILDKNFKDLQARDTIVPVNEGLVEQLRVAEEVSN